MFDPIFHAAAADVIYWMVAVGAAVGTDCKYNVATVNVLQADVHLFQIVNYKLTAVLNTKI